MNRALVVSIHDVSPHTLPAVKRIIEDLPGVPFSLLVVPNHHRRGASFEDPSFVQWLHERVAIGDEAVVHGYFHQRDIRPGENLRDQMVTRVYTAGEGEFFDLPEARATGLLQKALGEFHAAGFEPGGFIAPAWLLGKEAEAAVRTAGFRYTTRLATVHDLASGRDYPSQSLVWSVRAAWRRLCSLAWNRYLLTRIQSNPLVRIGIHPVDIAHPAIWKQIVELTRVALADRVPMTYLDWVRGQS